MVKGRKREERGIWKGTVEREEGRGWKGRGERRF